ncbi:MAG TPA: M1 family metallopeptidase, partial [Gemmataceae bacterium]|nr:M1 family metallopeptidase [Gemmataceae bacterium]
SVRRACGTFVGLLALLSLAGAAAATEPETLPVPRPAAPTETLPPPRPAPPGPPPWLPRYDLDVQIDVDNHLVRARQRVTWTNRHRRPAVDVVFNAHSHYKPPEDEIGFLAKMLELVRMMPTEVFEDEKAPPPLQIQRVCLGGRELKFRFEGDTDTTLRVALPGAVRQGETVVLDIDFTLRLPQKQGRWGQWRGLTFLSNWQPVVAVYDEDGWHPTPFIPWHQPFFNEAGLFSVRATLPANHVVAASAPAMARKDLGNGLQQLDLAPSCLRDFAILCSPRYREFVEQAGPVRVRCCAFPEHEHYARAMAKTAADAIATYSKWIGPYPYPEFTIAEAYFGWNGNECAGLVMIDERVFGMPELAGGYVEYLIAHETCHQWWYNVIGTNGYCETWMDEAMATFFSNRYLDAKHGPNNNLLKFPPGLEWLPNISRDAYRSYGLYGTIGRGEACATVQDMKGFGHLANLFSMCYDKGHRIVRMIEDRLGTANFIDFMHLIWCKYQFRILRVKDFQRELEAYTGRSWEQFFQDWLYGKGLSDWRVEKVRLEPLPKPGHSETSETRPLQQAGFLAALHGDHDRPCRAVILLHQKAEINEQTVLGISLDDRGKEANWRYQYRIPILPAAAEPYEIDSPPARVTVLPENRVRVEVLLPRRPVQVAVDPDQLLVDADPSNNWWKPPVKVRFTPCYTFLDETDLTTAHDRWNVIAGPWLFTAPWMDPWYTRSTMAGVRAGLYRMQHFDGGAYLAYRTDFRDVVAGADGLWDHLPWAHTQVGFSAEQRLYTFQG